MNSNGIFDLFLGLPLHTLITHVVVVVLPISAIALILLFFFPKFRKHYFVLTLIGLAVSLVSAFIAKQSGEALSVRVGSPAQHIEWGEKVVIIAGLLFIASLIWYFMLKKKNKFNVIVGYIAIILAVAALVISYLAGHSGAKATWEKRLNPVSVETIAGETTSSAPSESTGPIELSMQTVAQKNTLAACWAVVSNNVYNLTAYVNSHPGGAMNITNLCGTDATAAFSNQHGQSAKPNRTIEGFIIGALGTTIDTLPTPQAIANNNPQNEKEENEGDED
jgi:cytochrome b involved in lipid metabolism